MSIKKLMFAIIFMKYWGVGVLGRWGNGGLGRWGGGYMEALMNGCRVAWLYGSRNGTFGKIHKLQIPNPKEHGTTALLKTQYPMNPPPHSPISPLPLGSSKIRITTSY
jgi:hypothetical protein